MNRALVLFSLAAFVILSVFAITTGARFTYAAASSTEEVQSQIAAHNQQISTIQKDIDAYQKQLSSLGSQKQTLQTSIKSLDVTKQKTVAQLTQTQSKIETANLELTQLNTQILTKEQAINLDQQTLAQSIRRIQSDDQMPMIAAILTSNAFQDIVTDIGQESLLASALQAHTDSLTADKQQLGAQQNQVATTKSTLTANSNDLITQKGQLDATEKTKAQLLAQTKSQESTYQSLLAQKKAQQKQFESELSDLENSLKNVSSSQIPKVGSGILAWPYSTTVAASCKGKASALGNIYCITQYFGNTAFATANAAIYSGMGHDGIDIGVPTGTPIQAALTGTVAGTGNTDLAHNAAGAQCYSFGKWVMIQHANGLNTMYAHLSVINVTKGQQVSTGDVIGYSGMTGYATGPHLHFGVYATAGVQYLTLNQFRGATTPCANASMPVAPKDAYLNPLSYL